MDFVDSFEDGTIYEIQGIYYNSHEALNLIWGAAMDKLGMMQNDALTGAGAYHSYAWTTKGKRYDIM